MFVLRISVVSFELQPPSSYERGRLIVRVTILWLDRSQFGIVIVTILWLRTSRSQFGIVRVTILWLHRSQFGIVTVTILWLRRSQFGINPSEMGFIFNLYTTLALAFIYHKNRYVIRSRERSPYSDWLRAGRLRGRSSSPGKVKNFLFSASFRPALGSTQPPLQWEKRPGSWSWSLTYTSTPPYAFMA
jgi:hypothetical protein